MNQMNQNIDYKKLLDQAKKDLIEKIVVGAILVKEEKILLLERPKDDFMGGIFELPSGNLEKGEHLSEGLIREIKEETGLDIKTIIRYINSFDYLSGSGKKVRQFNFLVELENYEPVILTEHDSFVWVKPENANKFNITEKVKEVINTFQGLKK